MSRANTRPGRPPHPDDEGARNAFLALPCIWILIGAPAGADDAAPPADPIAVAVATLLHGDPGDRLAIAEAAGGLFAPLCDPAFLADRPGHRGSVLGLEQCVRIEPDEWIGRTLLEELVSVPHDCTPLSPLFRAALAHPSPNYQRAALRWFQRHDDPDIEPRLDRLLEGGPPDWLLPDLFEAMMERMRGQSTERVLPFADHPNWMVWSRAIEVLGVSSDSQALLKLTDLAGRGAPHRRIAALHALTRWKLDDRALEAVLQSSHDEDGKVRRAAVDALGDFGDDPAAERLVAILRERDDPARANALSGLRHTSPRPGIADAVMDLLWESPSEENEVLRNQALVVLHNLDDPAVLPGLTRLARGGGGDVDRIQELVGYLDRDRDSVERTEILTFSCGIGWLDPDGPRTFRVVAPRGMRSVRCRERPGVSGADPEEQRLPAGSLVNVNDHFVFRGELWVSADGGGASECWLPRDLLVENAGQPPLEWDELRRIRRLEFDLPAEPLEAPPIRALIDAGLLIVIDPEIEVSGVALRVDPDLPLAEALAAAGRSGSRPLDPATAIQAALRLCHLNEELCPAAFEYDPGSAGEADSD